MLKSGNLYKLCNNVTDQLKFPEYINAAPAHTKAELIIRVPAMETVRPLRVINLESDVPEAFDYVDAIAFSTLAYWVAFLDQACASTVADARLLDALTAAVDSATEAPFSRVEGLKLLTNAAHALVPFDALAVVSLIRPEADDHPARLHIDFQRGHDLSRLLNAGFESNDRSFSRFVLNARTTLTDTIAAGSDRYQVNKYRRETRYIVGTPLSCAAPSADQSLLVVEFDQIPLNLPAVQRSIEVLSRLYGLLFRQADISESRAHLWRAAETLPRVTTYDIRSTSVPHYLEFALRMLSDSLHSTGCAFYEIVRGSTARGPLLEQAFYRRERELTEPNASWLTKLNDELWPKIHSFVNSQDADIAVRFESPSSEAAPQNYRLFARRVNLPSLQKDLLFVSFKVVEADRVSRLRMSETSKQILTAQLGVMERVIELMQMSRSLATTQTGLQLALANLFDMAIATTPGALDNKRAALLNCVHSFLGHWSPIETQHSAVYLFDAATKSLRMTHETIDHLSHNMHERANASVLATGLQFAVSDDVPAHGMGLTTNVWVTKESTFSFSVDQDGTERCTRFWDEVVGVSAKNRFFAGACIAGKNSRHGVLTVNGVRPLWMIGEEYAASWRLMPVLKDVAEALGAALERIA